MAWTQIGAVGVGLLLTAVYSVAASGMSWRNLSASVMIAAAALSVGALFGLLFGVPRSLAVAQNAQADASVPSIGANTNLERISDWLTTLIIGATLTQLGTVKDGAGRLFTGLAPAVGGQAGASAFAGSVVIYFAVLGFLIGWLYARLRLGLKMSATDALLGLSRRAESAGDFGTAQAARDAAMNITQATTGAVRASSGPDIGGIADKYDELRATPASPRRTGQMEDLVRQARAMAKSGDFSPQDVQSMFALGTPGRRVMALALMRCDIHLADFASVLQAIQDSQSAFEQYQGLMVANMMLGSLSADERRALKEALDNPRVNSRWSQDSARQSLARTISGRLSETP
ncbi:hypothetical protein [Kribbella sindirgiensis]|uniref:Uncharacterized protein n=1 Tax=Kribbella sindirgiensis TaxID=1124744 RepID=A0A4R0IBJ0_9ACTN|nr:hypothetical protein [Kribbella sindirgiensis]TCC30461.1 hypothetical protein E0H50_23925 [Kribbella sindirgiensis]